MLCGHRHQQVFVQLLLFYLVWLLWIGRRGGTGVDAQSLGRVISYAEQQSNVECCRNSTLSPACKDFCADAIRYIDRSEVLARLDAKPECKLHHLLNDRKSQLSQCVERGMRKYYTPPPEGAVVIPVAMGTGYITTQLCYPGNRCTPDLLSLQYCCTLASGTCSDTCVKHVLGNLNVLEDFKKCELREQRMRFCREQATTPAWPSCDGLKFCENFNSPSAIYNKCTLKADLEALNDFKKWQQTGHMEFFDSMLFLNISCDLTIFKAFACFINLQPTNLKFGRQICMASCRDAVDACYKTERGNHPCNESDARFGEISHEGNCLKPEQYTREAVFPSTESYGDAFTPCNPNPCSRQMCVVNHICLESGYCARNYTCVPGCPIDKAGTYVKDQDWIKMPFVSTATPFNTVQQMFCQCSADAHSHNLTNCVTIAKSPGKPCVNDSVADGSTTVKEDGRSCLCDNGTLRCMVDLHTAVNLSYTTALTLLLYPHNLNVTDACPKCNTSFIQPVCGLDGRSYINRCLSECDKAHPARYGQNCVQQDNTICSCPKTERCVPTPGVCLTWFQNCPQYYCESANCSSPTVGRNRQQSLFCDTCGTQHTSLCTVQDCAQASVHAPLSCGGDCHWSYPGRCRLRCSLHPTVCGVNGQTYYSECALEAAAVPLDYFGDCRHAVVDENVTDENTTVIASNCSSITCPTLPPFCEPMPVLPTACCPICGSVVTMLLSPSRSDVFSVATSLPPVRVSDLVHQLQLLRPLSHCRLGGYLLADTLVVVVQADYVKYTVSRAQVEACKTEALVVSSLIVERQATVSLQPILSIIVDSRVVFSSPTVNSTVTSTPSAARPQTISNSWTWIAVVTLFQAFVTR